MSRDFFEIVRPNPVLSVDVFTVFLVGSSFQESILSLNCPLESVRPLPVGSETLPLAATGDDCLLRTLAVFDVGSTFPLEVRVAPGLDLPADSGLSGKVVRRFGGVSSGKSVGTIGCGAGRTRDAGELGRQTEATLRPLVRLRPPGVEGTDTGDIDGVGFRRVGVDDLDVVRGEGEFKCADTCGLDVGVEGLEFWDGLGFSIEDDVLRAGRGLEGVVDLDTVGRVEGVEGLVIDEERLVRVDGRI